MRTSAFVSALVLLLISPAFAAPINVSESMLAENQNTPPPAQAEGCTDQKLRRSWIPFWRRQDPTIVAVNECGFTETSGTSWRMHY